MIYFPEDVKFIDIYKVLIHTLKFSLVCKIIYYTTFINSEIVFNPIGQRLIINIVWVHISTPYIMLPLLSLQVAE